MPSKQRSAPIQAKESVSAATATKKIVSSDYEEESSEVAIKVVFLWVMLFVIAFGIWSLGVTHPQ